MPKSDHELLLRSIARRLAETADREQVIEEVCESRNLAWSEAAELTDLAWREYNPEITRRQSPLLVPVAFSIFVGGTTLAAWQLLGLVALLSSLAKPEFTSFWDLYNLSFGFFNTLTNLPGLLFSFVTGMAMVLGSYYGTKDVWSAWLEAVESGDNVFRDGLPASGEILPTPLAEQPERVYTASGWVRNHADDPKLIGLVLDQLEKSENKDWVINSVALARGLKWQAARRLVEAIARQQGITFASEITYGPPIVFGSLGAFLAGAVITFQYLVLAGVALAPQFSQIQNSWSFMLFMFALGDYIQMSPGAFVLYVFGLLMLVGGLFALLQVAPSVYRWKRRSAL